MLRDECDRQELDVLTDDRHCLGRDAEGRAHYCDVTAGVVWVVVGDEIVHVEQTKEIARWVDYTATHVGWDVCRYDNCSLSEWLADTLSEVAV